MSAAALAKYVGKKTLVQMDELSVECKVDDARESYGRIDLLVTPTKGSGQKWVSIARTDLEQERSE